jgi:hypothetical protein
MRRLLAPTPAPFAHVRDSIGRCAPSGSIRQAHRVHLVCLGCDDGGAGGLEGNELAMAQRKGPGKRLWTMVLGYFAARKCRRHHA